MFSHVEKYNLLKRTYLTEYAFLEAGDASSDGKVIINKLHRFLRQRSVPASSSLSPVTPSSPVTSAPGVDNNNMVNNNISDSGGSLKANSLGILAQDSLSPKARFAENKVRKSVVKFGRELPLNCVCEF